MADKYHDLAMFERVVTLAWTHARIQFHPLKHRAGGKLISIRI